MEKKRAPKGSLGFPQADPLPDTSRQPSSFRRQASVKVRNRQPIGSRGWPTQPSRFVMVVVPLCNSSGNKQVKVFERDRDTLLSVSAWSLHKSPHQSPSGGGPETQSKACLGLRRLVTSSSATVRPCGMHLGCLPIADYVDTALQFKKGLLIPDISGSNCPV